jgi:hypothetical protein
MASSRGALPTFLIVGAMKAGTTSLADLLARHPDIGMSRMKELHYFDPRASRDLHWYRSQFASVAGRPARFEATPGYLYFERAPEQMARELPDTVRFVAILRDPVDRAYSHYWHSRTAGAARGSFEDALRDEPDHLARGEMAWWSFRDRGLYLRQVQRYAERFGRERLLVLLFDDLIRDPAAVADQVAAFVGVRPLGSGWGGLPHAHRARRLFVPQAAAGVLDGTGARRLLPPRVRRGLRLMLSVPFTPPPMNPGTRAELGRSFRADNEALAAWLGRDLTWTGM